MTYGLLAARELAQRTAAGRQALRAHLAEREAAEQERLEGGVASPAPGCRPDCTCGDSCHWTETAARG